ncbi:MAG: hypothetical protein HYS38_01885 [Acidobacteria bacterium]|nr:hypothetical protein [Acidobacteriota bacterium]
MTRFPYKFLAAMTLAFSLSGAMPGYSQEPNSADPSPSQLILPAGTWITVRVNQQLSSDQNQPGDGFTATLAQPLVVNGLVVARRGQTVGGRVAEAQKAGRAKGTSRLGLELTEISIVDGQQLPVLTQFMEYQGGTSVGQDATAIAAATGIGATIGAAADGGFGAGMGAIAGAAASTIGVLVTRGKATVVYPEAVLTFRTLQPLTISTERSAPAFLPVRQDDYDSQQLQRRAVPPTLAPPRPFYSGGIYYGGPRVIIHSRPRYFYPAPAFGARVFSPRVFIYSAPRFYHHHPRGHDRRR